MIRKDEKKLSKFFQKKNFSTMRTNQKQSIYFSSLYVSELWKTKIMKEKNLAPDMKRFEMKIDICSRKCGKSAININQFHIHG